MDTQIDSAVISRERCPRCAEKGLDTSEDNLANYDDGHSYCFSCGYLKTSDGTTTITDKVDKPMQFTKYTGTCVQNQKRGINKETSVRYDYQTSNEDQLEIANFYRDGTLVAQHLRGANKKFFWNGDTRNLPLWGQHLWKTGGKRLVITEGEYDCMTLNQLMGGRCWSRSYE
jgi:twinkle protein